MNSPNYRKAKIPKRRRRHRSDAKRNIDAILDAAERCLARDPDASMLEIAKEAGLGRMTLYGHFKTRPRLIEVVARKALDRANKILDAVDFSGSAEEALKRLVETSWKVTISCGKLVVAAEKALAPKILRDLHSGDLEDRVRSFISRAQSSREFRTDLSTYWLVSMFHTTLHGAMLEIEAGRLENDKAVYVIVQTLLGTYRPPARPAG